MTSGHCRPSRMTRNDDRRSGAAGRQLRANQGEHMKITRHEFLVGLGGLAAGLPAGAVAHRYGRRRFAPPSTAQISFAQCGEDLVASFIAQYLKLPKVTYLDVGAYDPVAINNTYYFYIHG